MLKVEKCLKNEKDRVSHYLHSSSEQNLSKQVQHELMIVNANQLFEKEHFGCHALLPEYKDVTSMGTSFVKQAEDAENSKRLFLAMFKRQDNKIPFFRLYVKAEDEPDIQQINLSSPENNLLAESVECKTSFISLTLRPPTEIASTERSMLLA